MIDTTQKLPSTRVGGWNTPLHPESAGQKVAPDCFGFAVACKNSVFDVCQLVSARCACYIHDTARWRVQGKSLRTYDVMSIRLCFSTV